MRDLGNGLFELSNGATGRFVQVQKKDGTMGRRFRIVTGASAAQMAQVRAAKDRQITQAQAQEAFDRYYSKTCIKNARKADPSRSLKSAQRGCKAERTYDLNHTGKPEMVRTNTSYLLNPHSFEFPGVDTGNKVRKPLTDAQRNALQRGRNALAAKRQTGGDHVEAELREQFGGAPKRRVAGPKVAGLREKFGGYWW